MPPILTPAKGFPEEKHSPGFGASRKRQLCLKAEREDSEWEEAERVFHPEKRARISTGETFFNMQRQTHFHLPPFFSSAFRASF